MELERPLLEVVPVTEPEVDVEEEGVDVVLVELLSRFVESLDSEPEVFVEVEELGVVEMSVEVELSEPLPDTLPLPLSEPDVLEVEDEGLWLLAVRLLSEEDEELGELKEEVRLLSVADEELGELEAELSPLEEDGLVVLLVLPAES